MKCQRKPDYTFVYKVLTVLCSTFGTGYCTQCLVNWSQYYIIKCKYNRLKLKVTSTCLL